MGRAPLASREAWLSDPCTGGLRAAQRIRISGPPYATLSCTVSFATPSYMRWQFRSCSRLNILNLRAISSASRITGLRAGRGPRDPAAALGSRDAGASAVARTSASADASGFTGAFAARRSTAAGTPSRSIRPARARRLSPAPRCPCAGGGAPVPRVAKQMRSLPDPTLAAGGPSTAVRMRTPGVLEN